MRCLTALFDLRAELLRVAYEADGSGVALFCLAARPRLPLAPRWLAAALPPLRAQLFSLMRFVAGPAGDPQISEQELHVSAASLLRTAPPLRCAAACRGSDDILIRARAPASLSLALSRAAFLSCSSAAGGRPRRCWRRR